MDTIRSTFCPRSLSLLQLPYAIDLDGKANHKPTHKRTRVKLDSLLGVLQQASEPTPATRVV